MKKNSLTLSIETLLERSTSGQLTSNTNVFFGNDRKQKSARMNVMKVSYVPSVQDGILIVKSEINGSTNKYETTIQFDKVKYVAAGTQFAVPVPVNGEEMYVMPLKIMGNDVKVHCTCLDFYWRFASFNKSDDSLIGNPPPPYVKKTDRPYQNPSKIPGACKHITKLINHVSLERILK